MSLVVIECMSAARAGEEDMGGIENGKRREKRAGGTLLSLLSSLSVSLGSALASASSAALSTADPRLRQPHPRTYARRAVLGRYCAIAGPRARDAAVATLTSSVPAEAARVTRQNPAASLREGPSRICWSSIPYRRRHQRTYDAPSELPPAGIETVIVQRASRRSSTARTGARPGRVGSATVSSVADDHGWRDPRARTWQAITT